MTLTYIFQGQIWNLLYLSQKWSDCHEMKSKHIHWTLGFKCENRLWPWPWPWPWILNVKYRICYISDQNGPIAMKQKANISIEFQASNVTNVFDLEHYLDLWIFNVTCDIDLWPHTWPWSWIFMVKFWNSSISEWKGWLTLHKGGGSMSFMTMTRTIWWPRSGVWIYQIVTGVTSVVGMPSTHLVWYYLWWQKEILICFLSNLNCALCSLVYLMKIRNIWDAMVYEDDSNQVLGCGCWK